MMKLLSIKQLLPVLFVSFFLLPACSPKNKTAPVQFDYNQSVGCLVTNDFYAVYFSAYIKPEGDLAEIKGKDRDKLLRSYCKSIPKPGLIYLTADLVDDDVREAPVSIRLVEQELVGDDEKIAENFRDIRTVSEVQSKLYPRGVVQTQVELDKNGYYALYLMIGDGNVIAEEDILKIPFVVGVDPDAVSLWHRVLTILGVIMGVMMPITIGLIILSPILPIKEWVQQLNKINIFSSQKRSIES